MLILMFFFLLRLHHSVNQVYACSHNSSFPFFGGVDTTAVENVFDISPSDRLGFSGEEIVQRLIDGVNLLINMEKRLERSH